jgi:O-antigen/teichoic acid export membrane protein
VKSASEASRAWRADSSLKLVDLASANAMRFLATVVFARTLPVSEFGVYAATVMVTSVAVTLSNLGLPTAAARFLAEGANPRSAASSQVFAAVIRLRLLTWLPTLVLVIAFSLFWLPHYPLSNDVRFGLAVIAITVVSQSLAVLLEHVAAGLGVYRRLVVFGSTFREVVRLAGILVFLTASAPTAVLALKIEIATWLAMVLGTAYAVRGALGRSWQPVGPPVVSAVWQFAMHAAPVTMLSLASDWLGPMLTAGLGGPAVLAIYTIVWRCLAPVLTLLPLGGPALIPALARTTREERREFVRLTFPRATLAVLILTAISGTATFVLLPILFGAKYSGSAALVLPLALTIPGRVLSPVLRQILLMHHEGRRATLALACGAAITTIVALALRTSSPGKLIAWGLFAGSLVEFAMLCTRATTIGYQLTPGTPRVIASATESRLSGMSSPDPSGTSSTDTLR